jgi:hypothetical protein
VTSLPDTHYATTDDGVSIAYQIVGEGPVDLVLELESWGNVELMWELDALADLRSPRDRRHATSAVARKPR